MSRLITAMAVLVLTMGCGGAGDEGSQGAANHAEDAAKSAYGETAKTADAAMKGATEMAQGASEMMKDGEQMMKSGVQMVNDAIPATNTLTGTTGCGHCDFHVSKSCTAAMKTSDGTLYVLDGIDPESPLFQDRMKGNEVTVNGEIQIVDGQPHVAVASFEMM